MRAREFYDTFGNETSHEDEVKVLLTDGTLLDVVEIRRDYETSEAVIVVDGA